MSESGGGFSAPTSPTSGLALYGGDSNPKAGRGKSRLKRLVQQHRTHTLRKYEEQNMATYEELLTDLRTAVEAAAAAPEADREEILGKAFSDLDAGLTLEVEAAIEDGIAEAHPIVQFTEELAKSAGNDDDLAKGLTDVADFAYALQGVEKMMERMASIAEGHMSFPSAIGIELGEEDTQAQKDHAEAILGIITPFYSMGLTVLQRLTGATVAEEGKEVSEDEEEEVLKADLANFYSGLSKYDITGEEALDLLNKAFTPPDPAAAGNADSSNNTSPDDTEDGMDDSDVDPLETVKRLAAAILLQIDAIIQSDGDAESPEDQVPGQTAPQPTANVPPGIQKADIAQLMKSEVESQLGIALEPLVAENAALKAQIEALGKAAAPVGNKGAVSLDGRDGLETTVERLSKMSPEDARAEVFKAALGNPVT